jgi:hypothetical protein
MKLKVLAFLTTLMMPAMVLANVGSADGPAQVLSITTFQSDVAVVTLTTNGYYGAKPSCHTWYGGIGNYALDLSTNRGKAALSLAQAAQLAGKTVSVNQVTQPGTCLTISTAVGNYGVEAATDFTLNTN